MVLPLLALLLLFPMLILLSLLLLSLLLLLLLLLFEFVFDPRFPAIDIDDAMKFRKVNVEIAPDDSQGDSDSTSLYTTYLRPEKECC